MVHPWQTYPSQAQHLPYHALQSLPAILAENKSHADGRAARPSKLDGSICRQPCQVTSAASRGQGCQMKARVMAEGVVG